MVRPIVEVVEDRLKAEHILSRRPGARNYITLNGSGNRGIGSRLVISVIARSRVIKEMTVQNYTITKNVFLFCSGTIRRLTQNMYLIELN